MIRINPEYHSSTRSATESVPHYHPVLVNYVQLYQGAYPMTEELYLDEEGAAGRLNNC